MSENAQEPQGWQKLRALRKEHGYQTTWALCLAAGVRPVTVEALERGRTVRPGEKNALLLAATVLTGADFARFLAVKAAWFGAMIGVAYGEPFYSPGPMAVSGLPGLLEPPPTPGALPSYRMY